MALAEFVPLLATLLNNLDLAEEGQAICLSLALIVHLL